MKHLYISTFLAAVLIIGSAVVYSSGGLNFRSTPEWKKQVLERLNDPDSARFRDVAPGQFTNWTCGWVKSRNGFGGYGNWVKFQVRGPINLKVSQDSGWEVTFINAEEVKFLEINKIDFKSIYGCEY